MGRRNPKCCGCNSCCAQTDIITATISGLTNIWSQYNGSYSLDTNVCVREYHDEPRPVDGCNSSTADVYVASILDGGGGTFSAYYWVIGGIHIELEFSRASNDATRIRIWLESLEYTKQQTPSVGDCLGPTVFLVKYELDVAECLQKSPTTYSVPNVAGNAGTYWSTGGGDAVDASLTLALSS